MRSPLSRIAAVTAAVISAATRTMVIFSEWWNFDSRLSCDRLLYWGEWIACLHGQSHLYITSTELAAGIWLIAALTFLLTRSVSPYFAIVFPALVTASLVAYGINYWHKSFIPFTAVGGPSSWEIFMFAKMVAGIVIYLVGPLVAGWLLGLYARAQRRAARLKDPRDFAEVF
jgi:hypothetical protein